MKIKIKLVVIGVLLSASTSLFASESFQSYVHNILANKAQNPWPTELWEGSRPEGVDFYTICHALEEQGIEDSTPHGQAINDIVATALAMEADHWLAEYADEIAKHRVGLRKAGIIDQIPTEVHSKNCEPLYSTQLSAKIDPCDPQGNSIKMLFKDLFDELAQYVKEQGGSVEIIKEWWGKQKEASFALKAIEVKAFLAAQRSLPTNDYYWSTKHVGSDGNSLFINNLSSEKASFTIWHAYVIETLGRIDFLHNDRNEKVVYLNRVVPRGVLFINNITEYGNDLTIKSPVYDSYNIYTIFEDRGLKSQDNEEFIEMVLDKDDEEFDEPFGLPSRAIVFSRVPHHRVFSMYWLSLPDSQYLEKLKVEIAKVYAKNLWPLYDSIKTEGWTQDLSVKFEHKCYDAAIASYFMYKNTNMSLMPGTDIDGLLDDESTALVDDKLDVFKILFLLIRLDYESLEPFLMHLVQEQEHHSMEVFTKLLMRRFHSSSSTFDALENEYVVISGPDLPFNYKLNEQGDDEKYAKARKFLLDGPHPFDRDL